MEVVGAVSLLITLLDTARTLFIAAKSLHDAIEDAPEELKRLFARIDTVTSLLLEVIRTQPELNIRGEQLLSPFLCQDLDSALITTSEVIQDIKSTCTRPSGKVNLRGKLPWAFLERSSVEKFLRRLKYGENHLSRVLQVIQL